MTITVSTLFSNSPKNFCSIHLRKTTRNHLTANLPNKEEYSGKYGVSNLGPPESNSVNVNKNYSEQGSGGALSVNGF